MSRPANQNIGIPCYVKASKPGKHVMTKPVNQNMGNSCFVRGFVMASKPKHHGHSMLCHCQQTKTWKFYAIKAKTWECNMSRSVNQNIGISSCQGQQTKTWEFYSMSWLAHKQEMSQTRYECPQRNWSSIRHI